MGFSSPMVNLYTRDLPAALAFYGDLSHSEIAEVMGCSEGTVRSRLHYSKQFLQGELNKYLQS